MDCQWFCKGSVISFLIVAVLVLGVLTGVEYFYFISAEPLMLIIFLSLRVGAWVVLLSGLNLKRLKVKLLIAILLVMASVGFAHYSQGMQQAMMKTLCDDADMNYDVTTNACVKRVTE